MSHKSSWLSQPEVPELLLLLDDAAAADGELDCAAARKAAARARAKVSRMVAEYGLLGRKVIRRSNAFVSGYPW